MWLGLHGTMRASSRTPKPRADIRRASSAAKSLICVSRVAGKAVACLASCRHTGNVFRLRPDPGLTARIGAGTDTEEKTIMGRAAAADSGSAPPRGPFAVDRDRALAELELAWSGGGYHGFTAAGGTWCPVTSAGELLSGTTPEELARAIRAHWQGMRG
jgi:hypothetical protein